MGATALLPALVGHQFAMEMMLAGRFYRGEELRHRGLFNHIVDTGEVLPLALDLASRLAERPRHVLELVKATLAVGRRQALLEAQSSEHLMHQLCFSRPDAISLIDENFPILETPPQT
jgi:polyketide biosynthesis enoyl-CoA hydratase PksI